MLMKVAMSAAGALRFRVPTTWTPQRDGNGMMWAPPEAMPCLRLSVLTFSVPSSSPPVTPRGALERMLEEGAADVTWRELPGKRALLSYETASEEEGDRLSIRWWHLSRIRLPVVDIAVFSLTSFEDAARNAESRALVEALDAEIMRSQFTA